MTSAKTSIPQLSRVYNRQRLFELLDFSLAEYAATTIVAPAGSGKTTLMASYIQARELSCLWCQLDGNDADTAAFFYYLRLAARELSPEAENELPLFTAEYQAGFKAFSRSYFERLFALLPRPCVLVLDNYQEVPEESELHEMLGTGLDKIPQDFHVLLASRMQPLADLTGLKARNKVYSITWPELRLSSNETGDLVQMLTGQGSLQKNEIQELHRKTKGWMSGVLLFLQNKDAVKVDLSMLGPNTPEEVFDYFAREVLQKTDKTVFKFLIQTSLLPRMSPDMARELTGMERAVQILYSMNSSNFFTERRRNSKTFYQYHPLFREYLLARLESEYAGKQLTGLKEKAAGLLEQDGQVEAAFELYQELGDAENMARLICDQAHPLMLGGRYQTLQKWLHKMPKEHLLRNPWLIFWQAGCRLNFDPDEAKKWFEKALQLFQDQKDDKGLILTYCGIIYAITYSFRSFKPLDSWTDKFLQALKNISFPSKEIEARTTGSLLYVMTMRMPGHSEFSFWKNKAQQLLNEDVSLDIKVRMLISLILNASLSGDLSLAQFFFQSYKNVLSNQAVSDLSLITFKDIAVFFHWVNGDLDLALENAEAGIKLSHKSGISVLLDFIYGHAAATALSSGNLELAAYYLDNMSVYLDHHRAWSMELFHDLSLWKALLEENSKQVVIHAEHSVLFADKQGTPQTQVVSDLAMCHALFISGKKDQAFKQLDQTEKACQEIEAMQVVFSCRLARAEFLFKQRHVKEGCNALKKAFSLGRSQGYVNTYFWRPKVMAWLCVKALEADIEPEYVRHLIRKRGLVPDSPPRHLESWPWPIKIFTLDGFQITSFEQPIAFTGRVQQKPLLLLKALLAIGQKISSITLQDLLWPDIDGDVSSNTFSTTVHRLRKLLGHENAVIVSDGKVSLNEDLCWVDAWDCLSQLRQAENLWLEGREEEDFQKAACLTDKAMQLKKGLFLPGEDFSFVTPFREQLKDLFVRCLEHYGRYHEQKGEYKQAISCYNKGLELDPCSEILYRRLMLCYKSLGYSAEAVRVYDRCCKNLKAVYGLQPSPPTRQVYKSIAK